MSEFKKGDRVRCIKKSDYSHFLNVTAGNFYTVKGNVDSNSADRGMIELEGFGEGSNCRFRKELFELVKEEKMGKFKVGDKVRALKEDGTLATRSFHSYSLGQIYTVTAVGLGSIQTRGEQGQLNGWLDHNFELVQDDSLESLIKTANAGLEALETLRQNHSDQIQISRRDGSLAPSTPLSGSVRRVQLKPKIVFQEFTTSNGWKVHVENEMLHIGCKKFNVSLIKSVINSLLCHNMGRHVHESLLFDSTRNGIYHDDNMLSWADAEKILNELKKMEQK